MNQCPILFSGEMVKAILEGRKTQTRRVVKPVRGFEHHDIIKIGMPHSAYPWAIWRHNAQTERVGVMQHCPYGQPGDRLWVRETLRRDPNANIWYYAAGKPEDWVTVKPGDDFSASLVWAHHKEGDVCVSIHMPRWASRITLEITKVRVERVQEITEEDAVAEGIFQRIVNSQPAGWHWLPYGGFFGDWGYKTAKLAYQALWDSINAKRKGGIYSWAANPWVWAITEKRVEKSA